uniref:PGG domain-containing protein n=1 Tax=Setaria italica TaxID=4555 RepID=K3Y1X5_SETIT
MEPNQDVASQDSPLEYHLQKYLLLLATLVAAMTYAAGFNPPGGVWEDTNQGYLAGEPIIRATDYHRYLFFYYCNATAFASSIVLIILILILAIIHEKQISSVNQDEKKQFWILVLPLRLVMMLDLLGLMGAYAAGTGRDTVTWVLVTVIFVSVLFHVLLASCITYMSGLSAPGGFWDSSQEGHRAGDPIMQEHHSHRLRVFFFCNTVAFTASVLIIMLLLDRKMLKIGLVRCHILYAYITIALVGLGGAYAVGSCREMDITIYVVGLAGAVIACICIQVIIYRLRKKSDRTNNSPVWQDNKDGHKAGDPILLSTNPKRYKVFFYCNSAAFVASLAVIILVQYRSKLKRHMNALKRAMILGLFSLMGAYAAGSCRDVSTSIYVIALAGAVLVYVVIHVAVFMPEDNWRQDDDDMAVHKRRKRLLLFAVLGTTLTYQAGLTPPSGFHLEDEFGHGAGDPILFHNYPRRYRAFYYCNSVSFMSSIALIILLANSNLYKPAIRSYALSVCTAAGLFGLMGAYAAGSTQHLKTSIYIFVLVALVLAVVIILLLIYWREFKANAGSELSRKTEGQKQKDAIDHAYRKYLMLLGVLAASVTYQAGLNPPGGVWQENSNGHAAGDPVMQDNRKHRYRAFFYSNSISFAASIVVIILLIPNLLVAYASGSTTEWEASGHIIALIVPALVLVAIYMLPSFNSNPPRSTESRVLRSDV